MKKFIMFFIVSLVALTSVAIAGEIDGLWWSPQYGDSAFVLVRENGGTVLAVALGGLEEYPHSGFDVFAGTMKGDTIVLNDFIFSVVNMKVTITLLSNDHATAYVNYCYPIEALYCIFPSGVSFYIEKFF